MADDDIREIKYALNDPTRVLTMLGMLGDGKARSKQSGGWMIRCPVHQERSPSCSVQQRKGVILWNCWGCGESGDVLHLVAAANGMSTDRNFRDVLGIAARMGGLWHIVDRLEGRSESERRAPPPPQTRPDPIEEPPREWPPIGEVESLWGACIPTSNDASVSEYLRGRALDPCVVDARDLGRALPSSGQLPRWSVCRGGDWRQTGYRLVLPMFDATGAMRSVRVARVIDGDGPKRRPPFGHKASELVLADRFAREMLCGTAMPYRLTIAEGEPDMLSLASVVEDARGAVVGVVSGSWTPAFASRVPVGCRVSIRTHTDAAGDRYAAEIESTLRRRAFLWRLQP